MKINLLPLLMRMKVARLWLFSVILSVLLTEAIVSVMGLLLKGEIPFDYLLTGLVASGFVATLVVSMLSYFLEKLTESQLQLNAIIETEPECVKLLAADGRLLQMNRAGLEMIEADSLDQVIGLHISHLIMPEYRKAFVALTKQVFKGEPGNLKFEICGLKGTHHWLDTHAVPLPDSQGRITALLAVTCNITERKQAEQQLTRQLRYLNIMERVSRISATAKTLEAMLDGVLKEIQLIFDADRAWFLYPCDPKAGFWSVPMECTRPEWPGAFASDMEIPVTEDIAALFQAALETDEPLQYAPLLKLTVPAISADKFSVKSQLQIALRPQIGSPWLLGIHHCSKAHIHDADDLWIFTEIAQRITETLSSLISLKSLRESEEHFRLLIKKSPVAIGIADKHGDIELLNDRFTHDFGYTLDDIPNLDAWWPLAYPEQNYRTHVREIWTKTMEKSISTGKDFNPMEFRVTCKNRMVRDTNFYNAIVGERILVFFNDITEQKQAEAELRIAATAFESQEAMSITDADQVILKVNKAFTRVTGYSPEEVIGQTHAMLNSGRQDLRFYRALQHSLKQDGYWEGEIWNRRKNGEIYPEWLSITTVSDANNRVTNYVAAFTDITKDKETEQTIHNLAYYDPLTALPNRRLLWERLKHSIEMGRRDGKQLALLMLDLDRFKMVNDSMGHLAGDELLQQVAARIKARLRDVDMIARLGGDEFIVLLENISHPEDAARVAENIVADLSNPFQLLQSNNIHPEFDRKVRIGASIGISLFPQHGDSPESLIDNADIALYKAKDEGRGCFAYFSEEFTQIAHERIALETRLRRATEQRELCVYYQAQIDIDTGLIIGAEALVRWQSPSVGLISPASFIPIAEETGLIVEIGAWVLRETCLQGRRWIDDGLPSITLAVNVSPHQFRRSDISALVAEVLRETGFPAELLELELTESGLMENEDKAVEVLNNLRSQGVRLAIDDFGTGYSSLAYLKRFPLDVLKIDKSFIDDIPSVQDDMEITATIVAMGHILGFKVLAEGVETLEQLAFLREKGCDTYQGFIKSKPLPAEEFAQLLRDQV